MISVSTDKQASKQRRLKLAHRDDFNYISYKEERTVYFLFLFEINVVTSVVEKSFFDYIYVNCFEVIKHR